MNDPGKPAFLTETALAVDDTSETFKILKHRFPCILAPKGEYICYATSNRQAAVKSIAGKCDVVLVIGAPNSSNSLRLVEVAQRSGCVAHLVQRGLDVDLAWFDGARTVGITDRKRVV